MRYKYIELYNYIGIYNGMDLTQIKIDLTLCKTNKIIIRGLNGSGKSTLMDAINPLPDSNDCFIPGSEARKNICIINNDIEYTIRYIHAVNSNGERSTTKGYILKNVNGIEEELNPNGNITSCKEIIFNEFNLDANFLALSKLGTESRGLAYMLPSSRKKLVVSIISVLETYNNIYKILNKKSSIFKSTINSLTYKIDSIGDETTLQLNLTSIENRIKELQSTKSILIENIAGVKVKISEYLSILQENNYENICIEIMNLNRVISSLDSEISKLLATYNINDINSISTFYDHLNSKCIELETDIEISRKQIPTMLANREAEYNELQNKTERLNSLQSEYNYSEVKQATNEAREMIKEYERVFEKMGNLNINMITKEEFEAGMESLYYLKTLANNLTSEYTYQSLIDTFSNRKSIKDTMCNLKSFRDSLSKKRELLSDLDKKLMVFESKRTIANELINRPSNCKIDECPYIKSAIDANLEYPESEYNKLLSEYQSLKEEINELENIISDTEYKSQIIVQFESIERELNSKKKIINKLPIDNNFIDSFMSRVVNGDNFYDIDELYKYVDCSNMIEEYKVAKETLNNYESQYQLYKDKNGLIESIICDIESLKNKTDRLAQDIDSLNTDISKKEKDLINLKSSRDKIKSLLDKINNEYNPSKEKESELINIKNSLENNKVQIENLQLELNKLNTNLGSIDTEINNISNERDTLKHSSSLLKEYTEELEIYNTKYSKIEKIKKYSSPSTGIQTLFMELYMNKIIAISNDLLSLLFNGEFSLKPFIINENEFRIPCVGNGLMHDDISSMSTAQKCMISMILSFALLYQSSTKYNILRLDELDGGLDTFNRGYFINLLDQLMSLLNCEQCFIISHNNELNTGSCDLIILKSDPNENFQGNIIWKY